MLRFFKHLLMSYLGLLPIPEVGSKWKFDDEVDYPPVTVTGFEGGQVVHDFDGGFYTDQRKSLVHFVTMYRRMS